MKPNHLADPASFIYQLDQQCVTTNEYILKLESALVVALASLDQVVENVGNEDLRNGVNEELDKLL